VSRLVPKRPPRDAPRADRLRYARHWAIIGAVLAIPVWAVVFLWARSEVAIVLFVVVTVVTLLNIASLQWQIARAKQQ
jgi:hypothetical protein